MAAEAKVIQLSLKINGEGAFNTLKDLNEHISATRQKIMRMSVDDPGYKEAAGRLRDCIEKQKLWREEIYNTQKTSKGFLDDFKGELGSIASAVSVGTLVASGIQSAVGAVTSFFSNAQAAFVQGEQTQAQLSAAIKSTGSAAGKTQEQLNVLSTALMQQTGINSDLIAQSEALLLTFTNISGEIYDQTLPLILDMSKALGQDLQASSIQVGKALNDPLTGLTALKKVGVSFTEQQKIVIKTLQETGDMAGAQKIILNELSKEFGGVAEAVSKTGSGQLEAFNTRIEKIQESVGGFITTLKAGNLSALEPFVKLLEKITTTSVSKKLEGERLSLNAMRIELESTNTSQKRRLEIINELKREYPAYLEKIDADKAKNTDLLPILNKINEAFVLRIAYQKRAEKMDDAIKEEADLMNNKYNKQQQLIMQIAKIQERLAEDGIKFTIKGNTENEKAHYIQQNLTKAVREHALANRSLGQYISTISYGNMVAGLTGAEIGIGRITEKLKEQQDVRQSLEVDLKKFKESHHIKDAPSNIHDESDAQQSAEKAKAERIAKAERLAEERALAATELAKKRKGEAEHAAKDAIKEFEKLDDDYKKLKISQLQDSLAANEKEIQAEKDKYQALIDEREKYLKHKGVTPEQKAATQTQINNLKTEGEASVATIHVQQEEERLAKIKELRDRFSEVHKSQLDKEVELIKRNYAKLKEEAKGNSAAIKMLETNEATDLANAKIREEERFQKEKKALQEEALTEGISKDEQEIAAITKKYDEQIEAKKAMFSEELQLTQGFQDMLMALEARKNTELITRHKSKEEEIAKQKKESTYKTLDDISGATFSIMANNRHAETQLIIEEINNQREAELANKDLTEEQKKAINDKYNKKIAAEKLRGWEADRVASIAQATIQGALAVVRALASAPPPMNAILATAAGIASAAQIAVIVSQRAPKFARGGQLPQGPSHAAGGISLIDPFGKKVGEIEGGEPILSKETYANNRQLIDTLLYSSQRLNGARINVNTQDAIQADRMFRYGGLAPAVTHHTTHHVNNQTTDLSVLVTKLSQLEDAVREEKARPVHFNYRVFEEYRDKMDTVRASVNA